MYIIIIISIVYLLVRFFVRYYKLLNIIYYNKILTKTMQSPFTYLCKHCIKYIEPSTFFCIGTTVKCILLLYVRFTMTFIYLYKYLLFI